MQKTAQDQSKCIAAAAIEDFHQENYDPGAGEETFGQKKALDREEGKLPETQGGTLIQRLGFEELLRRLVWAKNLNQKELETHCKSARYYRTKIYRSARPEEKTFLTTN
ncbi:uncharacterized protein [Drosophila pseudoobscura]|uniref:Uncharacterized protein n=1 Tax=Drosophila pseudoobscura pseudoobscura TaxID=46245 RepID=A0A6I8VNJ3_DROPS|nr:uncharacterized protein LOC26534306 [Drosophila pseudoobscura]